MGNAQADSRLYMGMMSGWPQPMMTISVGGVRVARVDGGMDSERTRMYSWQFCDHMVGVSKGKSNSCRCICACSQAERVMKGTYTAEEMPDENHEHAPRSMFVICVERFESMRFLVHIQYGNVCDFFELLFCGCFIVDFNVAFVVC